MDLRKLKALIAMVQESNIAELEVSEGEFKVRVVKTLPPVLPTMDQTGQTLHVPSRLTVMDAGQYAQNGQPILRAGAGAITEEPQGDVVRAPMVGTYYSSATPGAAPFVTVGAAVKLGEALCIIEAMKLMNEIESEFAGTIKEIYVENGQPVEYGQPLFLIG